MLDIKFIRENPEKVKQGAKSKNVEVDIDKLLELDKRRRELIAEKDGLRAEQNKKSKGGPQDPVSLEELRGLKERIKILESELEAVANEFDSLMLRVPNLPMEDVPIGKDEKDNKVVREWGEIPKFKFKPKDHLELGENLGIIDTETASKVSGTRFGYLKGAAAMLEFALIQYAFSILTSQKEIRKIASKIEKGYSDKLFIPVMPPVMIRPEVYIKMARLSEEDKEERYYLEKDNIYLIGSAEHTLGPMHMEELIDEKKFPLRYLGFSTSFRREAGSYGKDTRGILRVHQFDKLEIESFTLPENGLKEQEFFVAIQEKLMQDLKLPYRVVMISTGDMGKPDARQIDIESWMPGQNTYRETHTSDYMSDYQARRLGTKVRWKDGSSDFIHMNDATAFAVGRAIIAIIENYQTEKGTIKVPKALQKYMFGIKEIK